MRRAREARRGRARAALRDAYSVWTFAGRDERRSWSKNYAWELKHKLRVNRRRTLRGVIGLSKNSQKEERRGSTREDPG